jgi:hypothetical protein
VALLLGCGIGALRPSSAHAPNVAAPTVLAVYQSNYTTAQENFTVSMEVADTTGITFVFFTFCQLSSSLCYLPVSMSQRGTNWYVGTTNAMTSYPGMKVGVRAGYNITIDYANNSTVTEPSAQNTFKNLTIAQSVTGEYMFQMTVRNQLYGLSGKVTDSTTGKGVAGAKVTIAPGNNSTMTSSTGVYSFSDLANGSYTISVTEGGYRTSNSTVAIDGSSSADQNIAISNATGPKGTGNSAGSGSPNIAGLPVNDWAAVSVIVVIAALVGILYLRRKQDSTPPDSEGSTEPPNSIPEKPQ